MSRRVRIGIIVAIAGVGLVVVGLFVLSRVVRQSLAPLPMPTPLPPLTQSVVVTTHDVAIGALLRAADLTLVEVPIEIVPRNSVTNLEAAVGRITAIPLVGGEMVMTHHLADPTNVSHDLAFEIGDDQVLMAFPIADLMTELNILQRGDQVDILVSSEQRVDTGAPILAQPAENEQPEEQLFTFSALQRVSISAIVVDIIPAARQSGSAAGAAGASVSSRVQGPDATPEPTPTPRPSQVEPRALLLALSPQDALILKHLKDSGGIFDIVLRSPTSTQLFELDPVMPQYLIDRYGLEITR